MKSTLVYVIPRWMVRFLTICQVFLGGGNRSTQRKSPIYRTLLNSEQSYKGKVKTHKNINRQISQKPENCENRNDPDLVQAFLKKWWLESDFKAPNLPLSLRLKVSSCHYNSIYNNIGTKQEKQLSKQHQAQWSKCQRHVYVKHSPGPVACFSKPTFVNFNREYTY